MRNLGTRFMASEAVDLAVVLKGKDSEGSVLYRVIGGGYITNWLGYASFA
jgi:hypothetical protein